MTDPCKNYCPKPEVFPRDISNRPGLSHIDYRIGTYSDFREALMRSLNANSVLENWTHREGDDPGIALLEGASVLGDILTFYQELYANEAYLPTAQWRESIADLVRLTGYLLAPGVGGKGTFALEVKGTKSISVPVGFPLKADLEKMTDKAEFGTTSAITAYPQIGRFSLYRPSTLPDIKEGTNTFSIETSALEDADLTIEADDRLMLKSSYSGQVVVVDSVEERFDRTEIRIKGSFGGSTTTSLQAYKLGRTFRHFGYNAPTEEVTVDTSKTPATMDSTTVDFTEEVGTEFPLAAEVDDLSIGANLLIRLELGVYSSAYGYSGLGDYVFSSSIEKAWQGSYKLGSMTGGATFVELSSEPVLGWLTYTDIRKIEFFEVEGDYFALEGAYEQNTATDLSELSFYGYEADYKNLDKRKLFFLKGDGTYTQETAGIDKSKLTGEKIKMLLPVSFSSFSSKFSLADFPLLTTPTVTVFGNLVDADQGKTQSKAVLGSGDKRQTFQTFKIPKSPLTHHKQSGETPPEVPELKIYVEDRLWKRVPSFFGKKADEEIYVVRQDPKGDSWVQFGDGKTGRRLPSGQDNVVALYRTGNAAYGKLKKDTKVQAGGKLDGLDKIQLAGIVSGGDKAESGGKAQQAAPGKVQSLGRLVSIKDFESEALAISGVEKARAEWKLVDNLPTLRLTVLMESGRANEVSQVGSLMRDYNRCRGAQRFPVDTAAGKRQYVCLSANYAADATLLEKEVKAAILAALGVIEKTDSQEENGIPAGLFSLAQREFGQDEYAKRIAAAIQNVKGVLWAEVVGLTTLGVADDPIDLSPPSVVPASAKITCNTDHILALYEDHLSLTAIDLPTEKAC